MASSGRRPDAEPRIGIDLAIVARMRRMFDGRPDRLAAIFTDEELRYSTGQRDPFPHLAARFAAKEAAWKALGTGVTRKLGWREVETVHGPLSQPRLVLRGEASRLASTLGLPRCAVSLTHAGNYALAIVLLVP